MPARTADRLRRRGSSEVDTVEIQQLGRDKMPGIMHGRCRHTDRFKPDRPVVWLVDLSRIGLRAACIRGKVRMVSV